MSPAFAGFPADSSYPQLALWATICRRLRRLKCRNSSDPPATAGGYDNAPPHQGKGSHYCESPIGGGPSAVHEQQRSGDAGRLAR
jgi:hypothetical protein